MLNGKSSKTFLLRSRIRQECPCLPLLFNIVLNFLVRAIMQLKIEKMLPHWNRSKTALVCIWYMWKNLYVHVWVRSKSLQAHLTLCEALDCSPPASSVHGILLARILEWVTRPSSRGSSQPMDQTHVSCVSCITGRFFTHWTIREAHQRKL